MSTTTTTTTTAADIPVAARRPSRPASTRPEGVRLTRRGRAVVLLLALVVLGVVGVLWSATSSASDESTGYPTRTVVVSAGDTLWDIADDAAGDDSTYAMVAELQSLNALEGGGLQAGQQILVPLR